MKNEDRYEEQGSGEFDAIRTNLEALAMKSSYTPTQYQKILQFLDEEYKTAGVVNMASNVSLFPDKRKGYFDILNVDSRVDVHDRRCQWIVDSGATCHMTSNLEKLDNVYTSHLNIGKKVYLPNGQTTLVTHSGSCMIRDDGILEDVLVVPDFKYDMLSVS